MTARDLLALEHAKEENPDDFPYRAPGYSIADYWAFWTSAQLTLWRQRRGK